MANMNVEATFARVVTLAIEIDPTAFRLSLPMHKRTAISIAARVMAAHPINHPEYIYETRVLPAYTAGQQRALMTHPEPAMGLSALVASVVSRFGA